MGDDEIAQTDVTPNLVELFVKLLDELRECFAFFDVKSLRQIFGDSFDSLGSWKPTNWVMLADW